MKDVDMLTFYSFGCSVIITLGIMNKSKMVIVRGDTNPHTCQIAYTSEHRVVVLVL